MPNLSVAALVAADASVGPKVSAAGFSIVLHSNDDKIRIHLHGQEALPMGLTVAESEIMALERGVELLKKVFLSIPLRMQLKHILLITDNEEVWNAFYDEDNAADSLQVMRDNLNDIFPYVGSTVVLVDADKRQMVDKGELPPEPVLMLDEAHQLAREYKRELGSILDE